MSAHLEALERRIRNVGVIREIVSSMRALSAVHLRHAAESLDVLRPYSAALETALAAADQDHRALAPPQRVLVIVHGTDQGLCGPLTARVARRAYEHTRPLGGRGAGLVAVGHRTRDALAQLGAPALAWERSPASVRGVDERVADVSRIAEARIREGLADGVDVVYARSLGAGQYEPAVTRIFPLDREQLAERRHASGIRRPPRTFERPAEVFTKLLDEWIYTELYRASLETLAAEHGARLRTTDAALSVIERRLDELRLDRNHARQHAITTELQEIVQAAEG